VGLRRQRLQDLARALPRGDAILAGAQQRVDVLGDRLPRALRSVTERRRVQLADLRIGTGLLSRALRDAARRVQEADRSLAPALSRASREGARKLDALSARLDLARTRRLEAPRDALARLAPRLDPLARRAAAEGAVDFARLVRRLTPDLPLRRIADQRDRLFALDRVNESLSYRNTLARGFAVVRGDGAIVTTAEAAARATALEIEFADGRHAVGQRSVTKRRPADPPPEQGSLL
jgi:exodeoxyribonuclease VII large subunit